MWSEKERRVFVSGGYTFPRSLDAVADRRGRHDGPRPLHAPLLPPRFTQPPALSPSPSKPLCPPPVPLLRSSTGRCRCNLPSPVRTSDNGTTPLLLRVVLSAAPPLLLLLGIVLSAEIHGPLHLGPPMPRGDQVFDGRQVAPPPSAEPLCGSTPPSHERFQGRELAGALKRAKSNAQAAELGWKGATVGTDIQRRRGEVARTVHREGERGGGTRQEGRGWKE